MPHDFPLTTLFQSAQKRRSGHVEGKQTVGFISFVAYINLRKVFAYFVTFIQVVLGIEISALQPKLICVGFSSFRAGFFPNSRICPNTSWKKTVIAIGLWRVLRKSDLTGDGKKVSY